MSMDLQNIVSDNVRKNIDYKRKKEVDCKEITTTLSTEEFKAPQRFEHKVFNYLLNNKSTLKIKGIYKLNNSRIDGLIEFENGELSMLEVKYRLSWIKCCNARIEFENFMRRETYNHHKIKLHNPPTSGIIIFENFDGDWNRKTIDKEVANGWTKFYEEQKHFEKSKSMKIDIVQLKENKLEIDNHFNNKNP